VSVPEDFQEFLKIGEVEIAFVRPRGGGNQVFVRSEPHPGVENCAPVAGNRGKIKVQIGGLIFQVEVEPIGESFLVTLEQRTV
jgi:hypothetical protein